MLPTRWRSLAKCLPRSCTRRLICTEDTSRSPSAMMNAIVADYSGSSAGVKMVRVPIPTPKPDEHLLKVTAVGVNRADLMQIAGNYPPPPGTTDILGLELAGRTEDGKEVCALVTGGAFAEYAVVPKSTVLDFPPDISIRWSSEQLAAIPEAFLAAYHVLFQIGKLSENETVLINAAGSGVGTSAIQLASTINNVTVIASAGTREKLDFCEKLGARHTINYKQENISDIVLKCTDGRGVDLVIDCVGAAQFRANQRSLRKDGRWVMYGLLSGARHPDINLAGIVMKRLNIQGTTMRSRTLDYRSEMTAAFMNRFGEMFRGGGKLRPIVDKEFDGLCSAADAFEYVQDDKNIGKVVVRVSQ
ncbi:alcohol dehydrogenase [Gracilaria domingensis]|nr:alcohol dehydrogenase [Gracilaria domingensis]